MNTGKWSGKRKQRRAGDTEATAEGLRCSCHRSHAAYNSHSSSCRTSARIDSRSQSVSQLNGASLRKSELFFAFFPTVRFWHVRHS